MFVVDSSLFTQLVSSRILHIRTHGRRQSVEGAFNFVFHLDSPCEFLPTPCLPSLVLGIGCGFGGSLGSRYWVLGFVVDEKFMVLWFDALIRSHTAFAYVHRTNYLFLID